jgi:hypothetical protein
VHANRRFDASQLWSTSCALALLLGACGGGSGATPQLNVQPQSAPTGPRVVAVDPPNGATGVDPARTALSATFDREMDPEGWAWVIENPATAPEIGESSWDAAHRVNTAQVKLAPGRSYVVWLNSPQFAYFRDPAGHTAVPFRWSFSTSGSAAPAAAPAPRPRAPVVVRFEPPNGASDVDPATRELRATFDRPMGDGWSWVMDPQGAFPEMAGRASLSADGLTAVLPVHLAPGQSYVVWLNSDEHRDFRDRDGVELAPVRWAFKTRTAR